MTVRSGVANGGGRRREGAHGAEMGETLSPRLPLARPVPRPRPRHPPPPSSIGTGAPPRRRPSATLVDERRREASGRGHPRSPATHPVHQAPPASRCAADVMKGTESHRVGGAFQLNFSDHLHQRPCCSCAAALFCTRCCARTAKCTGFACRVSRLAARHRRSTSGRLALEFGRRCLARLLALPEVKGWETRRALRAQATGPG
jgi:hypothetical protein